MNRLPNNKLTPEEIATIRDVMPELKALIADRERQKRPISVPAQPVNLWGN